MQLTTGHPDDHHWLPVYMTPGPGYLTVHASAGTRGVMHSEVSWPLGQGHDYHCGVVGL